MYEIMFDGNCCMRVNAYSFGIDGDFLVFRDVRGEMVALVAKDKFIAVLYVEDNDDCIDT